MQGEPERDELVMSLVESTLALPVEQRDDYLRSTCTADLALYEEVRDRVQWEERMGGFLKNPVVSLGQSDELIFTPGELVSQRFRIVRELGRGGMGVVYEASDEKLGRRIAVKCARAGFQNRLPPEARAALEVGHPNVCKLYELHTASTPAGPVDFLTMEFIEGESLAQRIRREGGLPEKEAREIALQICSGLAEAHRQGVIHGDLKAANIILSRSPEGNVRAVLTDFGLAKLKIASGGVHMMSAHGGTLDYMAPELFTGSRASIASDVYALGILLHEMLTGEVPSRESRAFERLPNPWNRIVRGCVAEEPASRFHSVDAAVAILVGRQPVAKWMVAAALAIIVVLVVFLWRSREITGPPVRLAVLPVSVEGPPIPTAPGIAADVADRLSGVRRNFTVISPGEAQRNQVDTVEKARAVLGATHVLRMRLRYSGAEIGAFVSIDDAISGNSIHELQGTYQRDDTKLLAKAVLATVTGAFGLRAGVPHETVAGPAYSYYVQGVDRMRRDNQSAEEAIPFFEKAIELDPRSALPYAGLADAQIQRFDKGAGRKWLDLAAKSLEKAHSLNADSVPVLLISGYFSQVNGKYEKAIADFSRAAQLDPSNSEAWRYLAVAFEKTNRTNEAIATYRKAIEAQPGYYRHYLDFGNFYLFRSQFREAEELYRRVTGVAPNLASGHMNLGLALMQEGRFQEAEQSLLKALELHRTPRLLMNLGALYYGAERYQDAARFFEESMRAGPATPIRYRNLGDAYRHLGRQKEAKAAYIAGRRLVEEDLTRNPRQGYPRALLALISAQLGDSRQAEFEVNQALAFEPENTMVMREAVIAYEVMRQRDKTLDLLRRAPSTLVRELNRQPDLKDLRQDSRFRAMISK
jgi:serine/threonine protein kinase